MKTTLNKFKIERGIPVPAKGIRTTAVTEALKQMKVGDSVLVPISDNSDVTWRSSARNNGIRVRGVKVSDTERRYWRTE